jgi:hypothetical protein
MAEGDSKLTYGAIPQQLQKKCNQSYWQMQVATFTKKSTLIDITYTVQSQKILYLHKV